MPDVVLDCKPLACPMPIVRISRAIKEMEEGQTLVVEAVDRAFRSDVEAWIEQTGHELLEFDDSEVKRAVIRKRSSNG